MTTFTPIKGAGGIVRYLPTPTPKPQWLKPCGTTAAYARHLRRGEPPCHSCMEANTEQKKWHRERRALRAEIANLRRQVVGQTSRGWICDIDGCWNPPLEDCLACEWATQQATRKDAA